VTPTEFIEFWLAQRPTNSNSLQHLLRRLTGLGMSVRRWEVFFAAYSRVGSALCSLHTENPVRVLCEEQTASAESALAAVVAESPAVRVAVSRTYTRRYWLDVHGGSARTAIALRQARHLVAVAAPGWSAERDWRTADVASLVRGMRSTGDFGAMPILADALQDAGCDSEEWLALMRDPDQPWFDGARVIDTLH
jgi:hypothetical protein